MPAEPSICEVAVSNLWISPASAVILERVHRWVVHDEHDDGFAEADRADGYPLTLALKIRRARPYVDLEHALAAEPEITLDSAVRRLDGHCKRRWHLGVEVRGYRGRRRNPARAVAGAQLDHSRTG
jgi:hypothetical protein